MVEKKRGRPVSGIKLLLDLVEFDNPKMQVRTQSYAATLHAVAVRRMRNEQPN